MSDYTEKFEKMRAAGNLAARTLDMLTDHIKPGVSTNEIIGKPCVLQISIKLAALSAAEESIAPPSC